MQIQSIFWGIVELILIILLIWLTIYSINLTWRNPDKLKKKAVENWAKFFASDTFVWMARIMSLIYGLLFLFLIFILVISLLGILRINK